LVGLVNPHPALKVPAPMNLMVDGRRQLYRATGGAI